jgi:tetratricopeptide (TPR) repeat protein
MDTPEHDNVDQQLEALHERAGDFLTRALYKSAYRVYGERARLARSARRLIPFMYSTFHQIHLASNLLEPGWSREKAIELLPLLESEDQARQFQSDYDEPQYEYAAGWMTACVYELLSDAIGEAEGYNSEGMHTCLSEGIQVCRRTGKLGCIRCFHGFAVDVYRASDDAQMALHYARSVQAERADWADRGDDRYDGAKEEVWLLTLYGHLQPALQALERARQLCLGEKVNNPWKSRVGTLAPVERQCAILAGGSPDLVLPVYEGPPRLFAGADRPLPVGEDPHFDLHWDLGDALLACREGDWQKALDLLTRWDRWLTEHHGLHYWFEVRLRLIAAHCMAGNKNRVEPLARQLEERAWKARDWLTMHRLSRMLDPSEPPTPLALLAPLDSGPFAAARTSAPGAEARPIAHAPGSPAPAEQPAPEVPPLDAAIMQFGERLNVLEDDAGRRALLNDVLAIPPSNVSHPMDAARLIHLLQFLIGEDPPEVRAALWRWAETVAGPFPQVSVVLNLFAALGDLLRGADAELAKQIDPDRLDRLFRQSIDLDPFHARNHFRAGVWHLSRDNFGEAERCLARGFRLERTYGPLALRLAEVYQRTDRPRDALMVLDTCLREGCEDARVAWEAAVAAFGLDQHEPLLTYLDRHEQLQPGGIWVNYYRTIGLLQLGRPQEALAAIEEESRRAPENVLPQHLLRACAAMALEQIDDTCRHLSDVLAVRLATVDYLTFRGLVNLFARLWNTVGAKLPDDDPLRQQLQTRLLAAGLTPDDLFEPIRERSETHDGVNFYRCRLRQPLDERWPASEGCLRGQEGWPFYFALWGVLARDEDEAKRFALRWQGRCYPTPAVVLDCEVHDEGYKDKPGVVWQGQRWHEENEAS